MNLYSDVKSLTESLKSVTLPRAAIAHYSSDVSPALSNMMHINKSKDRERDRDIDKERERNKENELLQRQREAAKIRSHVEAAARELSLERFARFENELYQTLLSYVSSTSQEEKVGGILCVRELISCTSASAEAKCLRISKALSQALSNNTADTDLVELIADTVGHMARSSPVSNVDYLESELSRALDWLRNSPTSLASSINSSSNSSNALLIAQKRFAACVMLQQLSKHAPTIFFARINEFFDLIWGPIWDQRDFIRIAAGRALSACLSVLKERTFHLQWYCYLYDQLLEGFHNGTEECVHGSTLVLTEALKYTGDFLIPRFKVICNNLVRSKLKEHKSRVVRACIVSVLPSLAQLCPDGFALSYLEEALDILKKCTKSPELRPQVLLSTGKLCMAIGPHLVARMEDLMVIIRDALCNNLQISAGIAAYCQSIGIASTTGSLSAGGGSSRPSSTRSTTSTASVISAETLVCISDMVQGLGSAFHGVVLNVLLEPMLQSGLTEELIKTLKTISHYMPNQRNMLQMRLLEEAVVVLAGGGELDALKGLTVPDYLFSWGRKGTRSSKIIKNDPLAVEELPSSSVPMLHSSASQTSIRGMYSVFSMSSLASVPGSPSPASPALPEPPSFSNLIQPSSLQQKTAKKASFSFISPFRSSNSSATNSAVGTAAANIIGATSSGVPLSRGSIPPASQVISPSDYRRIASPGAYSVPSYALTHNHAQSCELLILALHTLASLSVSSVNLIPLMQSCVLPYLNSDDMNVRREAAITCCRMLIICHGRQGGKVSTSTSSIQFHRGPTATAVEQIVTKLLEVAVSDLSVQVRMAVMENLTEELDQLLSRTHHLQTLFLLLADESFDMKLQAMSLLGRLAALNPASVLPPIRVHLMRLISEIVNFPKQKSKEEITLLLCRLLQFPAFHSLIPPFAQIFIKSILPWEINVTADKLITQTKSIILTSPAAIRATATAALEAVGELSRVLQTKMLKYVDQLLPILIFHVLDSTSSHRKLEAALRALGRFASSTGLVVRPYLEYPQLLPQFLAILCKPSDTQPESLRLELLRTLGLLGALEPARFAFITNYLEERKRKLKAEKKSVQLNGMYWMDTIIFDDDASDEGEISAESYQNLDSRDKAGPKQKHGERGRQYKEPSQHATEVSDDLHDNHSTGKGKGDENKVSLKSTTGILCTDANRLLTDDYSNEAAHLFMYAQSSSRSIPEPASADTTVRCTPSNDDYYPIVAISALKKVLKDNSSAVSVHHSIATNTIIKIFKTMGDKSVPFLEQIVPYLLQIIRKSGPGLRESVLQQLNQLVLIAGHHINPYLPNIVEILNDFWNDHLEHILAIVQQVAIKTSDSLTDHLPTLLPLLLSSICLPKRDKEREKSEVAVAKGFTDPVYKSLELTLQCHRTLREVLRPYIHLVVPALCKLVGELQAVGAKVVSIELQAVQTIRYICSDSWGAVSEHSNILVSEIVHTVVRSLRNISLPTGPPSSLSSKTVELSDHKQQKELYSESISLLVCLAQQVGSRIIPFDGLIMRTLSEKGFHAPIYRDLSASIRQGHWDENRFNEMYDTSWQQVDNSFLLQQQQEQQDSTIPGISDSEWLAAIGPNRPLFFQLNQHQLARSWDASQRSTESDWYEWLWRFNVDLLRESPVPALRVCAPLAQNHPPMAKELFHAAFVSCWHELNEQYQDNLIRNLQKAFNSSTIPSDILQVLLNLAEFMEHDAVALPINLNVLAELAQKGHAYAKALHYRELEFQTNPAICFESLININKKLDQYDAASGLLKVVQQMQKRLPLGEIQIRELYTVKESWLAKLGHWDEALEIYNLKLAQNPRDGKAMAGKIKCLDALGRWEEAIQLCHERLDSDNSIGSAKGSSVHRQSISGNLSIHTPSDNQLAYKAAVIGARAAWSLSLWSEMETFTSKLPSDSVDANFMKAVLAVHAENYADSEKYIVQTRKQLDKTMTSLLAESYSRSYVPFVMLQQCSELEEIIEFKVLSKQQQATQKQDQNNSSGGLNSNTNSTAKMFTMATGGALSIPLAIDSKVTKGRSNFPVKQLVTTHQLTEKKNFLTHKWRERIRGCCSSGRAAIPFWKYLLNCRRMVLNEHEDLDTWLDFVSLCRHGGNSALAERVLQMSQHDITRTSDHGGNMHVRIRFAILKQQWSVGKKIGALEGLENLISSVGSGSIGKSPNASSTNLSSDFSSSASMQAYTQSFLNCLLKLGEWKVAVLDPSLPVDNGTRDEVLQIFLRATVVDPRSYLAWHQWGLSNYRAAEELKRQSNPSTRRESYSSRLSQSSSLPGKHFSQQGQQQYYQQMAIFVPNAVRGLLRAISLGTRRWSSSVAQDMLCLLALWFKYAGKMDSVHSLLKDGLLNSEGGVHPDNWMGVLPQLIARIDHPNPQVRGLLHALLQRLGSKHAQALVFPLSVVLKSPIATRKEAAEELMNNLRKTSAELIDEALKVAQELVRVAILWEESWHWGLEEASRQYFGDGNVQAMLDILITLHKTLDEGANTIREDTFIKTYGGELNAAWNCVNQYIQNMTLKEHPIPTHGANRELVGPHADEVLIHQAWSNYLAVFKRINTSIPQIVALELPSCSPYLAAARDLSLSVPGTYSVTGQSVKIASFYSTVAIIRSKQRPRKIKIVGDNGQLFSFLLKGHEDLRQDERAMQLFGLVNALLFNDRRTGSENQDFSIQRYAVIPLNQSAGLISWVPNCDTMHDLIRNYRETRNIVLDMESKLILQVAPNKLYDSLPAIHKLEVFTHALSLTDGEDLAKILWFKSDNSESWLLRRASYTRSLAVMSMVGYILGLGDRHPSNLMLDRQTGKVLHIDFGDCFEVAMHREKYPEKVPFRLTRMLVNAMEVAGIEGHFRYTCEKVMAVLRENRDSLVATLEAFVHDPLISWRLVNIQKKAKQADRSAAATGNVQDNHMSPPPPPSPTSTAGSVILSHNTEIPRRIDAEEFAELTAVSIGSAVSSSTSDISETVSDHTNRTVTMPAPYSKNRFSRGSFHTLEPVPEAVGDEDDNENDTESSNAVTGTDSTGKQLMDNPTIVARPYHGRQLTAGNNTDSDTDTESEFRKERTGIASGSRVVSFSLEDSNASMNARIQISSSSEEQRLLTTSGGSGGSLRSQMHIEIGKLAENISASLGGNKLSSSGSVFSYAPARSLTATHQENLSNTAPSSGNNFEQGDTDSELTEKAVIVIRRVMDKLTGLDFNNSVNNTLERNAAVGSDSPSQATAGPKSLVALDVPAQVDRLIQEATSNENLSLSFFGWCPFW